MDFGLHKTLFGAVFVKRNMANVPVVVPEELVVPRKSNELVDTLGVIVWIVIIPRPTITRLAAMKIIFFISALIVGEEFHKARSELRR